MLLVLQDRASIVARPLRPGDPEYAAAAIMKRAAMFICLSLPILATVSCGHARISLPATPASSAPVARGESIVRNVAVCGHCHSGEPQNADGPLSGGREFHDWRIGTARASNLTPDPETELRRMSDDDLRAIYRYLRTLPPIRNEVQRRAR